VPTERQPAARPTPGDFQPLSEFERRLRQRILSQDLAGMPNELMAYISGQMELSPPKLIAADLSGIRGEEWREVGATGQPAFTNSWANSGGADETAAFYRDATGIVRLKGSIHSGTLGTAAFTLPSGYWPALSLTFSVVSNALFGALVIHADGDVLPTVGSNASFWLNVSFRAA
jgi:hypothetical protein